MQSRAKEHDGKDRHIDQGNAEITRHQNRPHHKQRVRGKEQNGERLVDMVLHGEQMLGKGTDKREFDDFRGLDHKACKGNFEPYNTYSDTKMFPLMIRPKQAVRAIYDQSYTLICLNDNEFVTDKDRDEVKPFLEKLFPEKSQFEK